MEKIITKSFIREQKLEGTKSSLHCYLCDWIADMNALGWKQKRLTKRFMREAFVPVLIEVAYWLLRVDHDKADALEMISKIVNDQAELM